MSLSLYQLSILLLVICNTIALFTIVFNAGKWKATIEQSIKAILDRLDSFEKRYGDLPERVAFIEGCMKNKDRSNELH